MNLYERLKGFPRIGDNGRNLPAYKKYTGEVGIEIETECNLLYDLPDFKFWKVHEDPSLRGAVNKEFVLFQPVKFEKELPVALDEFGQFAKRIPFIKDSITTSVHVHLNFLNSMFREMGNFITAYALTENLLSRFAGDYRESNLFCLPIRDAEETYRNCVALFQNAEKKNYNNIFFHENKLKYAALNLSAFRNFGSLEVRSFRGETDIDVIGEWLDILKNLYKYAHEDRTPKQILLDWKEKGPDILKDIYKEHYRKLIHKNYIQDLESNVWYAACIAYSVKDWIKIDEPVVREEEFKPTAKQMSEAARMLFNLPLGDLDPAQIEHVISFLKQKKLYNEPAQEMWGVPVPKPKKRNQLEVNAIQAAMNNLPEVQLGERDR